jgi:natural product precursor
MKNIKKILLNEKVEQLNAQEMKMIKGGYMCLSGGEYVFNCDSASIDSCNALVRSMYGDGFCY